MLILDSVFRATLYIVNSRSILLQGRPDREQSVVVDFHFFDVPRHHRSINTA